MSVLYFTIKHCLLCLAFIVEGPFIRPVQLPVEKEAQIRALYLGPEDADEDAVLDLHGKKTFLPQIHQTN